MTYIPPNPNGQATMANSSPVVIASNQSAIPTSSSGTTFTFSTVNSSVANLNSGATFTGAIESVITNQSYSVLFFATQNATITINQYIDAAGLELCQQLTFTYTANGQFARSGIMNGNYIKVTVQNTGGSATTTLQLNTAFGTIPSATQLNNSPSALNEINGAVVDSNSGNKSAGSQRVVIATDDVNLSAINGKIIQQADSNATGNINTQNLNPNTGTATAGSTIAVSLSAKSLVAIQVTGTYTGALTPQASVDGTNWVNLSATSLQNVSSGLSSGTIASGVVGIFQVEVSGFVQFRISALAAVTGAAVVTLNATSSTGIVGLDSPVGQIASASSLSVALPNEQVQDLFVTGQAAQTATVNNILTTTAGASATDTLGYRSFQIQVVSTGTGGTFIFESSNDNVNFQPIAVYTSVSVTATPFVAAITAAASSLIYIGAMQGRYLRLRIATTITGGSIQAFSKFSQTSFAPSVFGVGQPTANNLAVNIGGIGATAPVTAGVAGIFAIGGNIASGTARTANPVPTGATDINNLTRIFLTDSTGQQSVLGPGETFSQFSLGSGAAAVTDGTNGKTVFVPPVESDVYLSIASISTTPTMQLEGSYDNVNFAIIPLSKVDNTATSQQYTSQAAFTPIATAIYKGKSYGFPIIRVHLTAGTTTNTVGTLRVVPLQDALLQTISPFALNAASTTEAVGSANGQLYAGGVRTLTIPTKGSSKAVLQMDGVTGTLTYALEASSDGTNYNAINMQPVGGGPTVSSVAATGTAALPQSGRFEADLSTFVSVRVHCTAFTSGIAFGVLKIINTPTQEGLSNSQKPSYVANILSAAPVSAGYVLGIIEASATRQVFIKKLTIFNPGSITSAQITNYALIRQTTASASGTGTAVPKQTTDTFGGTYRVAGATAGTAGTTVYNIPVFTPTAVAAYTPQIIDFTNNGTMKGIVIPAGTTNGVYLSAVNGAAGAANVSMAIEFTEE